MTSLLRHYSLSYREVLAVLWNTTHLLLILITAFVVTTLLLLCSLRLLPPHTSCATTTKRTRQCKVNVLLRVQSHDE